MKSLKSITVLALLAVVAAGCVGGIEKILPRKDGTWVSTSIVYTRYVNSAVDSTWTDNTTYTYVFDRIGSVNVTGPNGTQTLTWQARNDIATLCDNSSATQVCEQYLILESSNTSQLWRAQFADSINGNWLEKQLALERAD